MTSRAAAVMALTILSLLAAVVSGRPLFSNLAYVFGGLLAVCFVWSRMALRGVWLQRERMTSRAQVGHLLQERITVGSQARVAKTWLDVRDHTKLPGYRATALTGLGLFGPSDLIGHSGSGVVAGLARGQEQSWLVRTVCTQRGRYQLGPTEVHGGDPFGLFPRRRVFPARQHVVVLPAIIPIRHFPIPTGRLPGGEALRLRTHQVTPNAAGVRDYAPGDSLNRIHWRSTARHDRLIAKEFEFDPLADLWIVLDAAKESQFSREDEPVRRGNGSPPTAAELVWRLQASTEEYAVSIAASLAFHFMQQDRDVGLIAHGRARHVIQPERGQAQLQRLLESLAVLEAEGQHSLDEVLKIEGDMIPRGATVVLITADVRSSIANSLAELGRQGHMPILLLLDAASFRGPLGAEPLLASLGGASARTRLIRCGDDLEAVLSSNSPRPTPVRRSA
jgi:uncharacterized protein (DUF58 family)